VAGRPSRSRALGIWANGLRVGRWVIPTAGPMELTYDEAWVTSQQARPLSLSLPMNLDGVRAYGVPVASCEVRELGGVKALVVERFDRALHASKRYWLRCGRSSRTGRSRCRTDRPCSPCAHTRRPARARARHDRKRRRDRRRQRRCRSGSRSCRRLYRASRCRGRAIVTHGRRPASVSDRRLPDTWSRPDTGCCCGSRARTGPRRRSFQTRRRRDCTLRPSCTEGLR